MNITQVFWGVLVLVSIIHVTAIILRKETITRVSKCFLIPAIIGAYISGSGMSFIFPVIALVLGWTGDVLLIRIDKKINFILGLASFLLGHLFYILSFLLILGFFGSGSGTIDLAAIALFMPPAIMLAVIVFRLIKPAREMYAPVIFYMAILELLTLFGFQVFLFNPGLSGLLLISGCLCFMFSDTILAYYTFRKLKVSGSVFIMVFYILAQAEIILGLMLR